MTPGTDDSGDESLKALREEVAEAADNAREKAGERNLEQARASAHGEADAYEIVLQMIDARLYGDGKP